MELQLKVEPVPYGTSRICDVAVIGWIDANRVVLDAQGVRPYVLRLFPPNGRVREVRLAKAFFGGLICVGPKALRLRKRDRVYLLNWMFKFGANQRPPDEFKDSDELTTFSTRTSRFKLLNRLGLKLHTNRQGQIEVSIEEMDCAIGTTVTVLRPNGDDGRAGSWNEHQGVSNDVHFQINEGTPAYFGVMIFNRLAPHRLRWANIGSKLQMSRDGDVSLATQSYPTYSIYARQDDGTFRVINTIPQASEPLMNFSILPYHDPRPRYRGSAPFLP